MIALCAALACYGEAKAQGAKTEREAWNELVRYEYMDIAGLDVKTKDKIRALVNQVIPGRQSAKASTRVELLPWHFLKIFSTEGEARYVLLERQNVITVPGQAWLYVHVFNVAGKLLSSSDFSIGWRLSPKGARIIRRKDFDSPLLEISTDDDLAAARQYYAFVGDELVLIRLESRWNDPVRNNYEYPNLTIGPPVPGRSAQQWEQALVSFEPVEVLRALMWLGGIHRDPRPPASDGDRLKESDNPLNTLKISEEAMDESKLVWEVYQRKGTRGFLLAMTLSHNPWIRKAAEQALVPFAGR